MSTSRIKVTERFAFFRREVEVTASQFAILKLIEIKYKETFLKYLYVPAWRTLGAISALVIVVLFLSNNLIFASALIIPCSFSVYMSRKSNEELKRVRKQQLLHIEQNSQEEIYGDNLPSRTVMTNSQARLKIK